MTLCCAHFDTLCVATLDCCALCRAWLSVAPEVSANGSRSLPPLGNLSHWPATGPAALSAASPTEAGDLPKQANSEGSPISSHLGSNRQEPVRSLQNANQEKRRIPDRAAGVAIPQDVEAAMALVKELGYLPGTLGEHIARMRSEVEAISGEVRP